MWFKVISLAIFVSMVSAENTLNNFDIIPTLNTSAMANLLVPDDWVLFSYGPKGHKIREESIIRHEQIGKDDPFTVIVGFVVENHENKYIVRSYAGSELGIREVGVKMVDSTINLNAEDLAEEFSFIEDENEDKDESENESVAGPVFVKPSVEEDKDEDEDEDEKDGVFDNIEPIIENSPHVVENKESAAMPLVDPMIVNNPSVVEKIQPIIENPEPIVENVDSPIVDPVIENPAPVVENIEPIIENSGYIVKKIEPIVDNIEPIVKNVEQPQILV